MGPALSCWLNPARDRAFRIRCSSEASRRAHCNWSTSTPKLQLGPYEIVSLLGTGGMGEVYRARDPRLGREVAIKVLPAAFADDAERLRRFEREARAAAALNHPNIVTVLLGREK